MATKEPVATKLILLSEAVIASVQASMELADLARLLRTMKDSDRAMQAETLLAATKKNSDGPDGCFKPSWSATMTTQLELDFIDWLADLSAAVEWKYERWLEDADGGCHDDRFCADCVEQAQQAEIKAGSGYTEIHGWDDAAKSDSSPFCELCCVHLSHSPTKYCIEQDIDWLAQAKEMDASNAACLHNWLTGMGDYQRAQHWPQIEPHAKRLMKAAGVPVPKRGTIRFVPSCTIYGGGHWYPSHTAWLLAYEWVARKLVKWANGRSKLQFLNNTSSINNYNFNPLRTEQAAYDCLADLFKHAGLKDERADFLTSIGIESHADLDTPTAIPDRRPERIMWAFAVQGRTLRQPGPNQSHPEALNVQCGLLQFRKYNLRWEYKIEYGYPHDSSTWSISTQQTKGQSLPNFFASIEPWVESVMEADTEGKQRRLCRLRDWSKAHAALDRLFWLCDSEAENTLTDKLVQLGSRIDLHKHPDRLETLMQWIAEDAAKKG